MKSFLKNPLSFFSKFSVDQNKIGLALGTCRFDEIGIHLSGYFFFLGSNMYFDDLFQSHFTFACIQTFMNFFLADFLFRCNCFYFSQSSHISQDAVWTC